MNVSLIGVGNMGRHLARHILAAGHNLALHDARPETAAELLRSGATWAATPREAAAASQVVLTCLPQPEDVESVVAGTSGMLESLRPGTVCVDHTTNSVSMVRRLHAVLARRDVSFLDAPVSGGIGGAQAGTLTILIGGDAPALERCRPVLETYGKTLLHVGAIGTGTICKLTHNCAVFTTNLAMVECLTLGIKAGVDAATLIDVFQKSGIGRNLDLQVSLPATLFQDNFNPRFALRMAHKDLQLATGLGREYSHPMPLSSVCEELMDEAMARGWADRDNSIFLTLFEERAGVRVRVGS